MTDKVRVKLVLYRQQPFMVIWPVCRPGQVKWLVWSQERGIKAFSYVFLRSFQVELVNPIGIFVWVPVDKELGVALET